MGHNWPPDLAFSPDSGQNKKKKERFATKFFNEAMMNKQVKGQPNQVLLTFQRIFIEAKLANDVPGNVSFNTLSFFGMAFCCF